MVEVIKFVAYCSFGVILGLAYARHGWKKYYEGARRNSQEEASGAQRRGTR